MSITVILNCYRRPQNLEEQILAIRNQSIRPKEIWLWNNYYYDTAKYLEDNPKTFDGIDIVIDSSKNFKYHGRFTLGLLSNSDYLAYFDDDTIPGTNWFENCINSDKVVPGIYGGAGVVLLSRNYMHHIRVGWPSKNDNITEVDLVGHAWFFKRKYLNYLWSETPFSFDNGEDIQFSYLAQKHGVKTYCPPHPKGQLNLWSSLKAYELGDDPVASSNGKGMPYPQFCKERDDCVEEALKRGWKTIVGIK